MGLTFGVATFLGAFLLFQVQPLIAKYVLPWFGGGPGVWTSCLLFFQVVLLGGYAYAHLLQRIRDARIQLAVHGALLAVALVFLPVTPGDRWRPEPSSDPSFQILGLLSASVGLPYFMLSTTGPLLQAWFARANPHRSSYRLYALSNAGSLLALLSYPTIVEPWLSRGAQAGVWSWGFVVYLASIAATAVAVVRSARAPGEVEPAPVDQEDRSAAPTATARFLWFALPCLASVLLLGVTNVMCQDVAVIPLLWILPLSLYLLSFIVAFDSPRWYRRGVFLPAALGGVVVMAFLLRFGVMLNLPLAPVIAAYALGFFACAMFCHGEVYRLRPPAHRLTEFYLLIAAGGAAGGVLVALAAPAVFVSFAEFPIALWLVMLGVWFIGTQSTGTTTGSRKHMLGRAGFALVIAAGAGYAWSWVTADSKVVRSVRSFYGVLRVEDQLDSSSLAPLRTLSHGTTIHGVQFTNPSQANTILGYYAKDTGAHLAFTALATADARRIGVIGLGTGSLAAYAKPADSVRYYEINPQVTMLATEMFTYIRNAKTRVEVVSGDARLSLEREAPQGFDVLVLDAFSSDAIPSHLLTKEAMALYDRHLAPRGLLLVHITNRHLDLEPVVLAAADTLGLRSATIRAGVATWMILSRDGQTMASAAISSRASRPSPRRIPWTDEWTSLWQILK